MLKTQFMRPYLSTRTYINYNKLPRSVFHSYKVINLTQKLLWYPYWRFWTKIDESKDPSYGIFEELKEEENSKDANIKNLSLKLINTQSAQQVLVGIFENDYLRGEKEVIYGEELALILHFAVKHLTNVVDEQRIATLLDMLYNRLEELEFDFVLTTIWSLGILISLHNAEIDLESKTKVIRQLLNCTIPKESLSNLPSLIFSISCMISPEEATEDIYEVIRHISGHLIEEGLDLLEPLQASTILMGWSRLQYHNEDYLYRITNQMRRDDFFYDISDNDLCNIISSLSDLHYKDDKLYDILHEHVKIAADDIKPYGLFMIIQSYARVIPHKRDYYFDLYEP